MPLVIGFIFSCESACSFCLNFRLVSVPLVILKVTNRKPLINSYDAMSDKHATGYFRRPRVKAVLDFTLMKTPKATRRDWNLSPRTSTPGRKRSVTW